MDWYPQKKEELNKVLDSYLPKEKVAARKRVSWHGIIVPHAGYAYSGELAAKAYSLLKDSKIKKAVILAPSHYISLRGIVTHENPSWSSPLGEIKTTSSDFKKTNLSKEHAIGNQIPFLQKLGFQEILPLMTGEISLGEAKQIAKQILPYLKDAMLIISSDLSHFLPYELAVKKDKETINAIKKLNSNKLLKIENSACGIFPILILIELCKIKNWKPKLIEYKNSGDITGDKSSVVGYASLGF